MNARFLSALTLVVSTLGLLPAATATAQQAAILTYPSLEVGFATPQTTYDSVRDRVVIASIRQPSPFAPSLVLDLTVHPVLIQGPTTYVYTASFLNLKYSDFEIVNVLSDGQGYVVFLNRLSTPTDTWSSWVLRVDATTFQVSWAYQLQPPGGEGGFLRVREAIRSKGGYHLLAALDDELIDAKTVVIRLGSGGTVAWANSYQMPESVELFTLASGGLSVMAGGWISDLESEYVGEIALIEIDGSSGALLDAASYDTWTLFDLAITHANGAAATSNRFWVAGKGQNHDTVFFPINKFLIAGTGIGLQTGYSSLVEEFLFLPSGDLLAAMHDGGSNDKSLTVPGPIDSGTAPAFFTDLGAPFSSGQAALTSVDRAGAGAMVGGSMTSTGTLYPGAPIVALSTSSGALDYCAPKQYLPEREEVEIVTRHLEGSQTPEAVIAVPYTFILAAAGQIYEEHLCH